MDFALLRRNAHHFAAAPGDRAHIGVFIALFSHRIAGRLFDLLQAVGDFEPKRGGRSNQPLAMFAQLEDFAAIDPFALENAARIV